jgi:hypothetical protein
MLGIISAAAKTAKGIFMTTIPLNVNGLDGLVAARRTKAKRAFVRRDWSTTAE